MTIAASVKAAATLNGHGDLAGACEVRFPSRGMAPERTLRKGQREALARMRAAAAAAS